MSVILLDDVSADEQPQSGPRLLRGEVGGEHTVAVFGGDPLAIVADVDPQFAAADRRLNLDRPPLLGGIHRVQDQVEKHLDQLVAHDHQGGQAVDIAGDDLLSHFRL